MNVNLWSWIYFLYFLFSWAIAPVYPSGNDLVCQRQRDAATHITVTDHATTAGISIALIVKWALLVLAALALPVFIFKVFIIPFKVLLGLKAISLVNSLLLAALLFKAKFSKLYGGGFPYPGAVPGGSSSSSSSSSSAAADSFERDEYVDVVQPGDDIKRLLEYVRKRNKNWWKLCVQNKNNKKNREFDRNRGKKMISILCNTISIFKIPLNVRMERFPCSCFRASVISSSIGSS